MNGQGNFIRRSKLKYLLNNKAVASIFKLFIIISHYMLFETNDVVCLI